MILKSLKEILLKAIKVNADYEVALFHGQLAPKLINEAIEFLALFLENTPLFSTKKYSNTYLSYVESQTGYPAVITSSGGFNNWWGDLKDLELEKRLNSKITSTQFIIDQKWCNKTHILKEITEIKNIPMEGRYILKDPFGMSGQKFKIISNINDISEASLQAHAIMEPLFNRVHDFSHYIFPDGKTIAYQNFVNENFQFKGTFFEDFQHANVDNLSFYSEISAEDWSDFHTQLQNIGAHYRSLGAIGGFSIDSFTYLEEGKLKIRILSEVNYRRTMGRACYELAQKFSSNQPWCMLILGKAVLFETLYHRLEYYLSNLPPDKRVMILSPGDSRFGMIYVSAKNKVKGLELITELNELLSSGEFPVQIKDNSPSFLR